MPTDDLDAAARELAQERAADRAQAVALFKDLESPEDREVLERDLATLPPL